MQTLQLLGSLALLMALVIVLVQARTTRGLRRRLLAIVLVAALLPATAVALVAMGSVRDLLGLLDAPGVRDVADAGVGLARELLDREESALGLVADRLAAAEDPANVPFGPGLGWELRDPEGEVLGRAGVTVLAPAGPLRERSPERAQRSIGGDRAVLEVVRTRPEGILVVVRELPTALAHDLVRVQEGSQGLRQLGLYYRDLLTTRLFVLATASFLVLAAIVVALGRLAGERLVTPLSDLVAGTRRVAEGDLRHQVPVRGVGEVRELVAAFNGMTVRLADSEERRRRADRLAAWQGVARRLAHEIKNPLTPIQLAVHRVRRRDADPVTLDALGAIEEETRNLQRLAEEFSSLARLPEPRPEAVDLRRLMQEVVELYVPDGIEVRWRVGGEPQVAADRGQLRQVVSNLVKNAVEAMGRRGILDLEIDAHDARWIHWSVQDDGPGLPDPPARVFDAGYTTRDTGSGLGLAIVQRIVEDHGASIVAGRAASGGARFELRWPSAMAAPGDGSTASDGFVEEDR